MALNGTCKCGSDGYIITHNIKLCVFYHNKKSGVKVKDGGVYHKPY